MAERVRPAPAGNRLCVFPFWRQFKMGWALPFHANEFTFENSSWGQFDFYKGGHFGQKPPHGGDGTVSSHSQKDNEFRENNQLPAGPQACIKHLPSDRPPRGVDGGARAGSSGEHWGKGPALSGAAPWAACVSQGLWCLGAWSGPLALHAQSSPEAGARPAEPSRTPGGPQLSPEVLVWVQASPAPADPRFTAGTTQPTHRRLPAVLNH